MSSHPWRKTKGKYEWHYDHAEAGLPAFDQAVAEGKVLSVGDTFTLAAFSYSVFRLTADHPGAWLMPCHMDFHLEAGQAFMWSVADANGKYDLPPPPSDYKMCNTNYEDWQLITRADAAAKRKDDIIVLLAVLLGLFVVLTIALVSRSKPPSAGSKTPPKQTEQAVEFHCAENELSQTQLQ
jgi:hypothetical protein